MIQFHNVSYGHIIVTSHCELIPGFGQELPKENHRMSKMGFEFPGHRCRWTSPRPFRDSLAIFWRWKPDTLHPRCPWSTLSGLGECLTGSSSARIPIVVFPCLGETWCFSMWAKAPRPGHGRHTHTHTLHPRTSEDTVTAQCMCLKALLSYSIDSLLSTPIIYIISCYLYIHHSSIFIYICIYS